MRDTGAGGQVIGTELVAAKAAHARSNLAAAGLMAHVDIREGDARQTLRNLDRPVDLLLLDGWPQLAFEVLQIVEPQFAPGAVVVVDNVAHFRHDLGPVIERLSRAPYSGTILPLRGGTMVSVYGA